MVCVVCSAARLSTPAPSEPLPHLSDSANQLQFEYGARRLYTHRGKVSELKAFAKDANAVSGLMASGLDELSEFLGNGFQRNINSIHEKLRVLQHSKSYEFLVYLSYDSIELFAELLDDINREERFSGDMLMPRVHRR